MLTKLKLALALTATLAAGAAGFAAANTGSATDDASTGGWHQKMLEKYDTNHNGVLDPDERAQMHADLKAKHEAHYQKMLAKYDVNHDGKLEPNERKAMIDDRAAKRFDKLDVDGKGVITKAQFVAGFERMAMRRQGGFRHRHHRGAGSGSATTAPTSGTSQE